MPRAESAYRDVACPTCYAGKGEMCCRTKTRSGRWERAAYHEARKRALQAKLNEEMMAETLGPASDVLLDIAASEHFSRGNG